MTARRKSVLNAIMAAIALLAIIVGMSLISQTAKAESSVAFEQGAYIRIDTDHGAAESTTGIRFKATADSSVLISNGDDIHFSRDALYKLGKKYFEAYNELRQEH